MPAVEKLVAAFCCRGCRTRFPDTVFAIITVRDRWSCDRILRCNVLPPTTYRLLCLGLHDGRMLAGLQVSLGGVVYSGIRVLRPHSLLGGYI